VSAGGGGLRCVYPRSPDARDRGHPALVVWGSCVMAERVGFEPPQHPGNKQVADFKIG
jgi:hypothetical protein